MSTPAPWARRRPRVAAIRRAAHREPVDWAKVGRRPVRRRATVMTHTEVAAALEEARLQRRLLRDRDRDREDVAEDERGPAELAEWERIEQLLAATGGVYDPDADAVVQDDLAADAERERAGSWRTSGAARTSWPRPPAPPPSLLTSCNTPCCEPWRALACSTG